MAADNQVSTQQAQWQDGHPTQATLIVYITMGLQSTDWATVGSHIYGPDGGVKCKLCKKIIQGIVGQ